MAPPAPARSQIVVRRPKLAFPDTLDDIFPGEDLEEECFRAAFSLMLPYVEPYLIRTFRRARSRVTAPRLVADVEAFCGQEAQHHKHHATVNRVIRDRLGPDTAGRLLEIEADLERDYRRFEPRGHRFNTAYAEGFEALTCAMGLTNLERVAAGRERPTRFGPWQQLWAWHLAEEIEHRTVAFDLYHHLGGRYWYRVVAGAAAQWHFLRYLGRFHRVLMEHHGARPRAVLYVPRLLRTGWRRWLRTYAPSYDPRRIPAPPEVDALLAMVAA
jgi:hypothetical protein